MRKVDSSVNCVVNTCSVVKKVLQNLTSLLSKMTSRIEARAQERMTRMRRSVKWEEVAGARALKMTASMQ